MDNNPAMVVSRKGYVCANNQRVSYERVLHKDNY